MKFFRTFMGPIIVGLFVFINIFIWSSVFASEHDRLLTIAFLDVGQGDAIYIEAPNGNQILVDGGSNSAVIRELGKVMSFSDRTIDVIVATHPDKDHIAGLIDVFKRFEVSMYFDPGVNPSTGEYKTLLDMVEREGVRTTIARRGTKIVLGDGVYAEILFPDRNVSNVESNLASIVLKVVYGETEVMLTGDSPKSIEKYLVSIDGNNLESNLLKAGHHGSKTSSAESFIGFVNPKYVIISAGKDNRYGHPHKEVLDIFKRFGIETVSTAEHGTIIFTSNGDKFTIE